MSDVNTQAQRATDRKRDNELAANGSGCLFGGSAAKVAASQFQSGAKTMTAAEISRATKKVLIPLFGRQNVSVKHGRGTAHSWIYMHVYVDRACETVGDDHSAWECAACREKSKQVREQIDQATKDIPFSFYYDDFGYKQDNTSINVYFDKRPGN